MSRRKIRQHESYIQEITRRVISETIVNKTCAHVESFFVIRKNVKLTLQEEIVPAKEGRSMVDARLSNAGMTRIQETPGDLGNCWGS